MEVLEEEAMYGGSVNKSFLHKHIGVRVVTGLICSFSLIGSFLIILTFCIFPTLRTKSRQILVHIAIMDIGVAVSNLVGVTVYFDQYYYNKHSHVSPLHDGACKAQAFLALYSTYGSILWTNFLALYIYFSIVHHRALYNKWILRIGCVFCYLLPLGLSLWLYFSKKLGFSPYSSGGWCGLIVINPFTHKKDIFVTSFGYDMWIYLTAIFVSVLFIGSRSHIQIKLDQMRRNFTVTRATVWAIQNVDYKFILIPLLFIFLRMWTCIFAATLIYSSALYSVKVYWIKTLIYLAAIGDSGQGIANTIIFVLFTKKVRDKLLCRWCLRKSENDLLINKTEPFYSSINTPPVHSPISSLQ